MAKKKPSKQSSKTVKEFSSSPFKNLKGLSAFSEPKPKPQPQPVVEADKETTETEGQGSFAEEMEFLGVKALPGRVFQAPEEVKAPEVKPSPALQLSKEEREQAIFLDAVGSVEKVFKDEWPEVRSSKRSVPRRMKQVERGQIMPEVTLDLHGLSVESATEKLTYFLQDAVYQGFQTVLIVTGKGLHSSDGPVLRQAMESLLNELRDQVVEWGTAPKRYGGSGALVVFLRKLV